ncbi:hypothetical protein [Actinotalea subterranea]|uniref:hypothetical protein n=1 Tax=Actinotalea subterranea TaxID=2607497 RepID=UPI0011F01922|nr:hypothetical protein [Actinotalea subterranea]
MRLDEIRDLIINSDRERDWHDVAVGSYFKDVPDVDEDTFEWHGSLIVYKPDVDLTIQWGMRARQHLSKVTDAKSLWERRGAFPDPSVSVVHADVFWAGSLIDRVYVVHVDGGRAILPLGDRKALNLDPDAPRPQDIEWEYSASGWETGLARLLDGDRDFERYFDQLGIVVRD